MQKLLLPLLLILTACTPKYGYKSPTVADHSTEQMIVVMDYLAFVDDVGKLYNYDIAYNHKQLDTLKQRVAEVLHQKGYEDIVFAMLSSGIDLNRQMDFELYENKKNQEKLINPPFIVQTAAFNEATINQLLAGFIKAQRYAGVENNEQNQPFLDGLKLTPITLQADELADFIALPDSHILYLRLMSPRVSFGKKLGVGLLAGGLTLGLSGGAFMGIAITQGQSYASGVLIDNQSGSLLWKNFQIRTADLNDKFFGEFPLKTGEPKPLPIKPQSE